MNKEIIKSIVQKAGLNKDLFVQTVSKAVASKMAEIRKQVGSNRVAIMVRPVAPDLGFLTTTPIYYKQGTSLVWEKNTLQDIEFESIFIPDGILNNATVKMVVKAATGKDIASALEGARESLHSHLLSQAAYLILTQNGDDILVVSFKLENNKMLGSENIQGFAGLIYDKVETYIM